MVDAFLSVVRRLVLHVVRGARCKVVAASAATTTVVMISVVGVSVVIGVVSISLI